MISEAVLRRGLAALGEAYSRKVDASTVTLWKHALRELNDERFRYGVDVVIRGTGGFFPPPGVVLAAGFDMPRGEETRETPKALIRESEGHWAHWTQEAHVVRVVQDNPISEREMGTTDGAMHYIRRIAIASGLVGEDDEPAKAMPKAREAGMEG